MSAFGKHDLQFRRAYEALRQEAPACRRRRRLQRGIVMDMTGEHTIPAPREKVWEALNDADVLKASVPGCETLEKVSDTEFTATVMAKVGPVRTKFNGRVTLSDIDPPNGYTISGEGQGGAAGFGKGGAKVTLTGANGGTVLRYEASASVGGKMAQIGSRVVEGVAKKIGRRLLLEVRGTGRPGRRGGGGSGGGSRRSAGDGRFRGRIGHPHLGLGDRPPRHRRDRAVRLLVAHTRDRTTPEGDAVPARFTRSSRAKPNARSASTGSRILFSRHHMRFEYVSEFALCSGWFPTTSRFPVS